MFSTKSRVISLITIAELESQLAALLISHDLVIDSRKALPGTIFCAYPGTAVDGRDYIQNACLQGADTILWEPGLALNLPLANYPIKNLMQHVGILAAIKAGYPSQNSYNYAVTGTNGKTSISHWLNQAYTLLGAKTAIIGTTGAGVYPQVNDYASTTPDPITLQHLLAEFKQQAVAVLAMEVSSHALEQGRVNGVNFDSAIFTNLTLDHLDYHQTMENYYLAKEKLFYWHGLKSAIINSDDEYGQRLINTLIRDKPELNVLSYGIESGDLRASNIHLSKTGISFELNYQGKLQVIDANIVGRFNVYNLLAVIGAMLSKGVKWEQLAAIISKLKPVTGRMDAVIQAAKPLLVVDFAHTPDALEKALSTLREIKGAGRLICVFGCGGNRDISKRPIMGKIASQLADLAIVTTDNPRNENPEIIIDQITRNLNPAAYLRVSDRKEAIQTAIRLARATDIVLVAGKGHENYQEIQGVKHPFSDLELVAELLTKID